MTFKIKTGCYLELLTPEAMKLLRSTASKIKRDKNGENVSYLETAEVLYTFVPNKSFGQLLVFHPTMLYF